MTPETPDPTDKPETPENGEEGDDNPDSNGGKPSGGKTKCPKGCKPDKPAPGGKTDESGGDVPANKPKPNPTNPTDPTNPADPDNLKEKLDAE